MVVKHESKSQMSQRTMERHIMTSFLIAFSMNKNIFSLTTTLLIEKENQNPYNKYTSLSKTTSCPKMTS